MPKVILDKETYLDAVKKINTMSDLKVSLKTGVNRSTVYRFRTNPENAEIIKEAKKYLESLKDTVLTVRQLNYDQFVQIPIIIKWEKDMIVAENSYDWRLKQKQGLFNICKYLKVHPNLLDLDQCCELATEMKMRKDRGEIVPRGMSFYTLRGVIRSFFTKMHGIAGEYIAGKGVHAKNPEGLGKYATQKVDYMVRSRLEKTLYDHVDGNMDLYYELLMLCRWCFFTGTRKTASLNLCFINNEYGYKINKDKWIIKVLDKGDIIWDKWLIGQGLRFLKAYLSQKFNIEYDNLEKEIPEKVEYVFPLIRKLNKHKFYDIIKGAFKDAGLPYDDYKPIHLWRVTFAQCFLKATDYNYELCGSLGGWENTAVLKKSYGGIDDEAKERGLRRAVGLPVEDVTYELNWYLDSRPAQTNEDKIKNFLEVNEISIADLKVALGVA